jgi:hypothetical protein
MFCLKSASRLLGPTRQSSLGALTATRISGINSGVSFIRFISCCFEMGIYTASKFRLSPRPGSRPLHRYLTSSASRYDLPSGTNPNGGTHEPTAPSESDKVTILENTASAPWLSLLAPNVEDRLRMTYLITIQLALYIDRPMEVDENTQFLTVSPPRHHKHYVLPLIWFKY